MSESLGPKKIWLAVLGGASLLAAIVVWVILYGRGVVFHFAGVYITPGIFTSAAMVLVDVLIFLMFCWPS
jgi:hypothetical protein